MTSFRADQDDGRVSLRVTLDDEAHHSALPWTKKDLTLRRPGRRETSLVVDPDEGHSEGFLADVVAVSWELEEHPLLPPLLYESAQAPS